MPVFNTPISVYGTSGFLSVSQAERPVLRTPEQVHDFLSQFGTIEMWEVDDRHTSGEKVLRFFLTPRLRDVLGPAAHIVREINATGFKVCLFDAGLLPLYNLATALRAIAESPRCKIVSARRGRRLPHPDDQARVLRLALNAATAPFVPIVQRCADEFARG
jgi:hypothetical protein